MYTVFVTGPLASGKRAACLYLAKRGFTHIDMDEVAKEFLSEELVIEQLVQAYGPSICTDEGSIDRARLAKLAFADEESTAALNSIIWPLARERLANLLVGRSCEHDRVNDKLCIEIAMLVEMEGIIELADTVLGITADESVRIERALGRGMQLTDIHNRIALQADEEARAAICDMVIENNGDLGSLHKKLDLWLQLQHQERLF
jgi:dephospho-CoA kinase